MGNVFNKIYQNSIKNPENFWQDVSNDIFWFKKPTKSKNSNQKLCQINFKKFTTNL